jgi:hypothetical protein
MMFQAIVLRYTGRVSCFESYFNYQVQEGQAQPRRIPLTSDLTQFLEFVELDLGKEGNSKSMLHWVSKQHDGSIPMDMRRHFFKFRLFIEYIAVHIADTMKQIRLIGQSQNMDSRTRCIHVLQKQLEEAMDYGRVCSYGRVQWMAHSVISDIEEFVEYPFGVVDISSVPLGVSSKNGHEMINRHERSSVSYGVCLQMIVSYINNEINEELLGVLGYKKQRPNNVVNLVNG